MRTLYTNFSYPTEIHDVVKLFFDDVDLCVDERCHADICVVENAVQSGYEYKATCCDKTDVQTVDVSEVDRLQAIRLRKRYAKLAIYNLLVNVTGKSMPWGSLTGIRPTKLADQL